MRAFYFNKSDTRVTNVYAATFKTYLYYTLIDWGIF